MTTTMPAALVPAHVVPPPTPVAPVQASAPIRINQNQARTSVVQQGSDVLPMYHTVQQPMVASGVKPATFAANSTPGRVNESVQKQTANHEHPQAVPVRMRAEPAPGEVAATDRAGNRQSKPSESQPKRVVAKKLSKEEALALEKHQRE
jgi:hypothetical protein